MHCDMAVRSRLRESKRTITARLERNKNYDSNSNNNLEVARIMYLLWAVYPFHLILSVTSTTTEGPKVSKPSVNHH